MKFRAVAPLRHLPSSAAASYSSTLNEEAAPRQVVLEEQLPPTVPDDLCLATSAPLLDEIVDVIQRDNQRLLGLSPELASPGKAAAARCRLRRRA